MPTGYAPTGPRQRVAALLCGTLVLGVLLLALLWRWTTPAPPLLRERTTVVTLLPLDRPEEKAKPSLQARTERAHAAARREFFAHGLTGTRGRTGVLVYVSRAERYAEIVADKGVRVRIADAQWRTIVADLLGAAGRDALGDGLVAAVEQVGTVLKAELPGTRGDNQLPNRVIVLD